MLLNKRGPSVPREEEMLVLVTLETDWGPKEVLKGNYERQWLLCFLFIKELLWNVFITFFSGVVGIHKLSLEKAATAHLIQRTFSLNLKLHSALGLEDSYTTY